MAKILDLSVYNDETLDITMLDGSVLHIKKPTQALVIRMVELSQLQENQPEKVLDGLVELGRLHILSSLKRAIFPTLPTLVIT